MAEEGTGAYLTLAVESLEAEVESLREQLAVHERWIDSYGHPEEWVKRAQAAHGRAEAAEAKLAEVERERDGLHEPRVRLTFTDEDTAAAELINQLVYHGLEFSDDWRDLDAEGQIAQAKAWLRAVLSVGDE